MCALCIIYNYAILVCFLLHMFPQPKTIARFASRKTDSFCSTAKYLRDNLAHSHSKLKVPDHMIGTPVFES